MTDIVFTDMRKELKDMTLKELWELFPIVLTPHQPQWEEWARVEIETLSETLVRFTPIISHIGSTAIPGIMSKPIIDILVEISMEVNRAVIKKVMVEAGYLCMSSSFCRMSFNKGYTPDGYAERVFHIHIRPVGDNDEIFFRDYLRNNPSTAHEYEVLKLSLLPEYKNNRDGYTEAKTEFVKKVMALR